MKNIKLLKNNHKNAVKEISLNIKVVITLYLLHYIFILDVIVVFLILNHFHSFHFISHDHLCSACFYLFFLLLFFSPSNICCI